MTLILSTASGCGIGSREIEPPAPIKPITRIVDTYCSTYVPVYTSRSDTEETKRQVDKNNAVWLERCDEKWNEPKPPEVGERG